MSAAYERGRLIEMRSFYKALGDTSRLRIVHLLASENELAISSIAEQLKLSLPLLSWHLRRLERLGLVRTVRVGREARCTFDRARFAELNERGFRALMNPESV